MRLPLTFSSPLSPSLCHCHSVRVRPPCGPRCPYLYADTHIYYMHECISKSYPLDLENSKNVFHSICPILFEEGKMNIIVLAVPVDVAVVRICVYCICMFNSPFQAGAPKTSRRGEKKKNICARLGNRVEQQQCINVDEQKKKQEENNVNVCASCPFMFRTYPSIT